MWNMVNLHCQKKAKFGWYPCWKNPENAEFASSFLSMGIPDFYLLNKVHYLLYELLKFKIKFGPINTQLKVFLIEI